MTRVLLHGVELPDGWSSEPGVLAHLVVVISPGRGGGGYVTIDLERRQYRGGYSVISGRQLNNMTYAGRNWKHQLVTDAVEWLTECVNGRASRTAVPTPAPDAREAAAPPRHPRRRPRTPGAR